MKKITTFESLLRINEKCKLQDISIVSELMCCLYERNEFKVLSDEQLKQLNWKTLFAYYYQLDSEGISLPHNKLSYTNFLMMENGGNHYAKDEKLVSFMILPKLYAELEIVNGADIIFNGADIFDSLAYSLNYTPDFGISKKLKVKNTCYIKWPTWNGKFSDGVSESRLIDMGITKAKSSLRYNDDDKEEIFFEMLGNEEIESLYGSEEEGEIVVEEDTIDWLFYEENDTVHYYKD